MLNGSDSPRDDPRRGVDQAVYNAMAELKRWRGFKGAVMLVLTDDARGVKVHSNFTDERTVRGIVEQSALAMQRNASRIILPTETPR